jgi:hypothetical protein
VPWGYHFIAAGNQNPMSSDNVKVRRWLLVATTIVGVVLVAGAIELDRGGQRRDILPSVLLEVGAAFGLVGVLFLLERSFSRPAGPADEATGITDWVAAEMYEPEGVGEAVLTRLALNHHYTAVVLFHLGRLLIPIPAGFLIFFSILKSFDWVPILVPRAPGTVRAFIEGLLFLRADDSLRWPVRLVLSIMAGGMGFGVTTTLVKWWDKHSDAVPLYIYSGLILLTCNPLVMQPPAHAPSWYGWAFPIVLTLIYLGAAEDEFILVRGDASISKRWARWRAEVLALRLDAHESRSTVKAGTGASGK